MKSQQKKSSLSPKLQHHSQISTMEKKDGIHIPFDLTEEILSRLPVKSLLRFLCVSKLWASLITNSIMTWSLTKPRLLVILDHRLRESSIFSLSSYPLSTDKESVSTEQDDHALVRGINGNNMYQYSRGLICCLTTSTLYNTTTRQTLLLPKINSEIPASVIEGFFGYDPVENQYKVFCMVRGSQTYEASYQVFTLGDPKKQWREIRGLGTYLFPTMTTRVCINGKIYFRARIGGYPFHNMLLIVDVRSERFDHVEIPKQPRSLTLVNYKGKLGCICYSDDSAEMWVLEDHAEKQEWCKSISFMSSSSLVKRLEYGTCIAGVTVNDEILIMSKILDCADPLYAEYYDLKQEKIRRVELESTLKGQQKDVRIFSFSDHGENAMSLFR
ncbi:hypothetical protein Bca52824_029854 [Brassica carinata]|uniref:F-box domain-containing protein n=1 Tax=Brassica carinata TaxID=52824 RepID=A0A8X7S854_BRACI|nr:hypothetical protein Bca52824_029854 [Brassica carinata]